MDLQLSGKRALVTGSSTGIGRAIATVLAREGVSVVVHGRNRARAEETAKSIRNEGGTAHVALGDLATDVGADAVVVDVSQQMSGIDILVNNSGSLESSGGGKLGWLDLKAENWVAAAQQNLICAVRMIRAFVPGMRERGWGRVINIASGGATTPPTFMPDYCAAKAGVLNMTVSLSKLLARTGVTVNAISPGVTRTDMWEQTLALTAAQNSWPADEDYDAREKRYLDLSIFPCASTRYGKPEEIGILAAFLASPHATFVTGADYRIDGGQNQSVN